LYARFFVFKDAKVEEHADLPNIANVLLTADALLTELNSIGDKITNAGTSIRVMLARAGLPHEPKKEIVARPPKGARSEEDDDDEDDDDKDSEEEERDPEPPRKKKKGSVRLFIA
jgi:hypothetical protein